MTALANPLDRECVLFGGTRWSPLSGAPRCGSRRWVSDAVMISEGVARIIIGCRSRTLRQHRAVPGCPVVLEAIEHVLIAILEIGPLARVLDDVEQELVAGDLQILPVAVAYGALLPRFETPEQLARMGWRPVGENRQQIVAVRRIGGVGLGTRSRHQRRHPVHRDHDLLGHRSRRNPPGPARDCWDAKATFKQFPLHAGEWPDLGKPLAAVVAGENDDRVGGEAVYVERL